ncbi:MAG: DUF1972 domain-containing protein [Lachnospira sp.]|nr:DUF1972 domain-containing protein [Lachnospira sp.]
MIDVFIVGSKGIPAQYGGFETFVENLTARKNNPNIKYHVSCMNNDEKHFEYNGADCFNVRVPFSGAKGRIAHVGIVLNEVKKWKQQNRDSKTIVYILGCRIGPLLMYFARQLKKLDVMICCNPDGLEWKRSKWNAWQKRFLKYCEKCLVTNSQLAICDSKNIEQYINDEYGKKAPQTTFVAYGADVSKSTCLESVLNDWYSKFDIVKNEYYLIVGRFVPENNYETMIREFMKSSSKKDLVIVTNVEKNKFYEELKVSTEFYKDSRIKFVGTVYEQELIKKIRENAYAYIHGHEVGGTNPSLLEALASTKLNLLLDIGFNREVGEESALYWSKEQGGLSSLINSAENFACDYIDELDVKSTNRIIEYYSWQSICEQYESIWLEQA